MTGSYQWNGTRNDVSLLAKAVRQGATLFSFPFHWKESIARPKGMTQSQRGRSLEP